MRILRELFGMDSRTPGTSSTIRRVEVPPFEFVTFEDCTLVGERRINVGVYSYASHNKTVPLDRLALLPRAVFEALGKLAKEDWVPLRLRHTFYSVNAEWCEFVTMRAQRQKHEAANPAARIPAPKGR